MSSRHRTRRALAVALTGALAAACGLAGCAAHAPTRAVEPAPPDAAARLQIATFEHAWRRVAEAHHDPAMGGLDWDAVRDELHPRAASARTADELRPVLAEMLTRLGESHYQVFPGAPSDSDDVPSDSDDTQSGSTRNGSGELGFETRMLSDEIVVTRVRPGGPADAEGVRPGWVLLSADGHDVVAAAREARSGKTPGGTPAVAAAWAVAEALAGPEGSEATVVFLTGAGEQRALHLVRVAPAGTTTRIGHLPPLAAAFEHQVLPGTNVGYVRFNIFLVPVAAPFTRAIEEFVGSGADGVIVDLRGNPGGLGGLVMGMAGHFIDEPGHSLGRLRMRGVELDFVANPRAAIFRGPVAVLVDELSLSTSEIFAAGLQQLGRARVFGTRTAGMALPSVIEQLPNGDRLQLAIADLAGPDGERIEGVGVQPDEVVELTRALLAQGHDPVVEAATAWVKRAAAGSDSPGRPE